MQLGVVKAGRLCSQTCHGGEGCLTEAQRDMGGRPRLPPTPRPVTPHDRCLSPPRHRPPRAAPRPSQPHEPSAALTHHLLRRARHHLSGALAREAALDPGADGDEGGDGLGRAVQPDCLEEVAKVVARDALVCAHLAEQPRARLGVPVEAGRAREVQELVHVDGARVVEVDGIEGSLDARLAERVKQLPPPLPGLHEALNLCVPLGRHLSLVAREADEAHELFVRQRAQGRRACVLP
mmetsp:Transcript_29023/g.96375  ORF Transcript_29023/g.96375 Transcript_29023/m.96375 type:complete len:237 (-) Transcript_29023:205-915(-)